MTDYDNTEPTEEAISLNSEGGQIVSYPMDILLEAGLNIRIASPPILVDNSINKIKTDDSVVHDIEFTCINYESEVINTRAKELLDKFGKQEY